MFFTAPSSLKAFFPFAVQLRGKGARKCGNDCPKRSENKHDLRKLRCIRKVLVIFNFNVIFEGGRAVKSRVLYTEEIKKK